MSKKQSIETTLQKLMELCYSEDGKSLGKETLLDTKWLDPAVKKWCEERRADVMKSMSKALDVFYKRSSVSAFRIASLMQYLYQVEGGLSEKEIHRRVKQIYLSCADRILQSMLGNGGIFLTISMQNSRLSLIIPATILMSCLRNFHASFSSSFSSVRISVHHLKMWYVIGNEKVG